MQLKIHNGAVDLSGMPILTNINVEINTNSKIAVVGRNGCGKTTLLKAIAGKIPLVKNDNKDSFFALSGKVYIGMLDQMTFEDESVSMLEEIRSAYKRILDMKQKLDSLLKQMESDQSDELIKEYTTLLEIFTNEGGFYFEKEYEAAIKKFGFTDEDKAKPVSCFSGGQRTKLAFLKLLLSKPDLLLLDEPTNHLDIEAVGWLEEYLSSYKKALLIVSHDREFLDKTVNEVYEIEHGKTERYVGNYSEFTRLKRLRREQQAKEYEAQQKEIERISAVAERFRYKATKAKMAQSKLKQIERMEKIDAPDSYDNKTFRAVLESEIVSAKDVLTVKDLKIGFDKVLTETSFSVLRGERVGIIGGNGLGKSTLLKTIVGKMKSLGGSISIGANVRIGYFDQQMAQYKGNITVFDDFQSAFPSLNDFETRSALGAFLFSGEDVFKTLDMLSGGERVRLALCKIFKKNPNFLILDEPTNHMDILSKEVLEDILESFDGTLLFVSHDRYFIRKLANKLLNFQNGKTEFYEYGYSQYLESQAVATVEAEKKAQKSEGTSKKNYTTPGKEKAKRERAILKIETKISECEAEIEQLKAEIENPENLSDYVLLSSLTEQLAQKEDELLNLMEEWDGLN